MSLFKLPATNHRGEELFIDGLGFIILRLLGESAAITVTVKVIFVSAKKKLHCSAVFYEQIVFVELQPALLLIGFFMVICFEVKSLLCLREFKQTGFLFFFLNLLKLCILRLID